MIITKTTDESQTITDESQTITDDYRRVTGDYRRVTDESQMTTDESQTSHKRQQTSHIQLPTNLPLSFLNTFIKHYFQKGYGFPNVPMKRWLLLKEGKSRI